MYLCVSEGLQAHVAGNSRKILAICLLDSWRSWLFAWPSLPICWRHIVMCWIEPSLPRASRTFPASSVVAALTCPRGPDTAVFTRAFPRPRPFPCHAGLLSTAFVTALLALYHVGAKPACSEGRHRCPPRERIQEGVALTGVRTWVPGFTLH